MVTLIKKGKTKHYKKKFNITNENNKKTNNLRKLKRKRKIKKKTNRHRDTYTQSANL